MLGLALAIGGGIGKALSARRRKRAARRLARKIQREEQLQAGIKKEQIATQAGLAEQALGERFAKMGRYGTGQQEFERAGIQKQVSQSFETMDSQLRQGIYQQRQQLAAIPSWGEEMFGGAMNVGASYLMNDFLTPSQKPPEFGSFGEFSYGGTTYRESPTIPSSGQVRW